MLDGILDNYKYSNKYLNISDRKSHLKSTAQSIHEIGVRKGKWDEVSF